DIVALELACSPKRSEMILDRYRAEPNGMHAFWSSLLLDSVLLIPSYTVALLLGCRLAAGAFRFHRLDLLAATGEVLQVWAILAAGLDYLENYGLLRQAASGVGVSWWRWTLASSLAKWLIIGLALVYGLVALVGWFIL